MKTDTNTRQLKQQTEHVLPTSPQAAETNIHPNTLTKMNASKLKNCCVSKKITFHVYYTVTI